MNKKIDFMLCLLLGYLGIHKFYEKKVLVGILYLFTGGIFLIGWIYDCIKLGINLCKIKNNSSSNANNNFSQNVIHNSDIIEQTPIQNNFQYNNTSNFKDTLSNNNIAISKGDKISNEINPSPYWNEGTETQQEFATDLVDKFCNRFAKYLRWGMKDHLIEANDVNNIENALFMAIDTIDDAKWWCDKKNANDFAIATSLLKEDELFIDIIKKLKKKYN